MPVTPHLQTLSCWLVVGGKRQELLPREGWEGSWDGENTPDGKAAWPGQQDLSGAGLHAVCLVQVPGRSQGVQRMLKVLERVIHQLDKPSIFQSPVLILQFQAITQPAQNKSSEQGAGSSACEVLFHLIIIRS